MSKLIMLRGNSGSGKTTLAKALQKELGSNTMLISHDMIRLQVLNVSGRVGVERSLPLMEELLRYGRRNSGVTILEGILPSGDYSRLFETAVKEFGENIFAYYYDLSFEETLKRHGTKPNRADFGESEMRRWWQDRDFLETIPERKLKQDISLESAVELILRDMEGE